MSVPRDADALFEVRDDGRAQSISLRTGERVDEVAGFYVEARQELDYEYSGSGRTIWVVGPVSTVDDGTATLSLDVASRTPWLAGPGYAEPGRAWLRIGPRPFAALLTGDQPFLRLDAATTFVLVDPDRNEIPPIEIDAEFFDIYDDVIFEVPETFTTGRLMLSPGAGSRWTQRGYGWETPPPDDSVPIDLIETVL